MNNPTTLFDFFTNQEFVTATKKFGCVQTSILRYYLTAHTGKRLKIGRLNQEQIDKQINKLKKIEVDSSLDIKYHLGLIEKGGEMYGNTKTQMKPHISYGRRFFTFVNKSLALLNEGQKKQRNENDILSVREAIMDKSEFTSLSKNIGKKVIILNNPELYLSELKVKYPSYNDEKLYQVSKIALDDIYKFINSFINYRSIGQKKCSKDTYKKDIRSILRFIGWYKEYHQLTIDEVKIENIFPIISPYEYFQEYGLSDLSKEDFTDMARKEWSLRIKIKKLSKDFRKVLNKYLFNHLDKTKKSTKGTYVQALINFAYFLYKDITDIEENDDFQDISLIKSMRVCKRDIDKTEELESEKIIPFVWSDIEVVCERLRKEADQDYGYSKRNKNNKGQKLTKREKALHIQAFLAIAFFCVMPPDRQRTFRELTFGETLKYGIRDAKCNVFTSYEKLESGKEAKYYIHLLPHQYKTGKTYGTYWHEINNFEYADGKHFYNYLNQWLFDGYRDELATAEKTNAVFIRTEKGISYSGDCGETRFCDFIRSIFERKTKFPLNPHALRNIYITDINNKNVSEDIRKAIAYMMHHDIKTANNVYNKQTLDEKMALGVEFLDQYHSGLLAS